MNRRNLLKLGGAASMLPFLNVAISNASTVAPVTNQPKVDMTGDGRLITPVEYAELLQRLINENPNMGDRYGTGGAVAKLEREIKKTTGKEAAVFMPSGTLANQLAIKVLSGDKSKVFVQDQSHVYRDESDAAQLIHDKRLMPLAPNAANFTLEDLKAAIAHYRRNEVFETGIGAISIENTVRRRHEEIFDIEEIRKISEFARRQGIGMHLDGARLFMASTWSGVSIEEYSRHFDTVYISLYKYLGAGAGAVLAGTKQTIDTVRKWMKPYGTVMFQNWHNALIALHVFDGFEKRLGAAKTRSHELFAQLNKIEGIRVETFQRGSNTAKLFLTGTNPRSFSRRLFNNHNIAIQPNRSDRFIPLKINETLNAMPVEQITGAFKECLDNR